MLRSLLPALLLTVTAVGCGVGPCLPPGKYELFARLGKQTGSQTCADPLTGTFDVTSDSAAHVTLADGREADCIVRVFDRRPTYNCEVSIACSAESQGITFRLSASTSTRPEDAFVNGNGGVGDSQGGLFVSSLDASDAGCSGEYQWAASR